MLKHKRTLAGILAATMMLSMAACGGGGSQKDGDVAEGPQDPNAAAAAGTLELTDWEKSSGIFNTDETDEELYEKAKEEGKVTVYSISSRITKVANAFAEKYPGVEVEPFDISTNELLEKVTREYDAGPARCRRCPYQGPGRYALQRVYHRPQVLQLQAG